MMAIWPNSSADSMAGVVKSVTLNVGATPIVTLNVASGSVEFLKLMWQLIPALLVRKSILDAVLMAAATSRPEPGSSLQEPPLCRVGCPAQEQEIHRTPAAATVRVNARG
jgi:alpha-beta hydrolase superfamily lysophospholipase